MHRARWSCFALLLSTPLLACPGDEPVNTPADTDTETDTADGGACVPGHSVPCTCTGSDSGVQVCRPDGAGYDPCTCDTADDTATTGSTGETEGADTATTGETEGTDTATTGETGETTDGGPYCGDGVIDPGEGCDDGGESATCNADCTLAYCGDGIVNETSGEECDEGRETPACNADCTLAYCGDGIVNLSEACDDGGESAACDDDCTPALCGDGHVNATADEACDDAGESAVCNDDCTPALCGDGHVNATADEACDDGGESAACNVGCTVSACGDGVFNATAGELCDEGGPTAMCDGDCSLVSCGDGLLNPAAGEACDDAGESAACNADCSLAMCGDGITNVTAGEVCDDMGESLACDVDCSPAACGDGVTNLAAGEACDDAAETAACDGDCTLATCGDAHPNALAGELCDGDALLGATCQTQGFNAGVLTCAPGCAAYDTSGCTNPPGAPVLVLAFSPIKQFEFSWAPVADADYYQLEQSVAPGEPFVQLGGDMVGTSTSHTMPLHLRWQASYRLRACNVEGCTDSAVVDVVGSLAEAVGYVKSSNSQTSDLFGWSVALSADGSTLAVGAIGEDSSATGIDGDQASNATVWAGAVYVFVQDGLGGWSQAAYVKASNPGANDYFGQSVALSADGSTLAVGAHYEDSNATGIGGNQANNLAFDSGAVYVFARDGLGTWSQQAYVKASNTDANDWFGWSVSLAGDGNTLAVGAYREDGSATGIGGDPNDDGSPDAGAAYLFVRDGMGTWSQAAYVKASNTDADDAFGIDVALSQDGNTLAVGAVGESSSATGIDGDQADDSAGSTGATYVFVRDGMGAWSQEAYVKPPSALLAETFGWDVDLSADGSTLAVSDVYESDVVFSSGAAHVFVRDGMGTWSQQAQLKASNPGQSDQFGRSLALSADGTTLAVGARAERSSAVGLGGDQSDDSLPDAGATYVFVRDGMGAWSQAAYVKASNTGANDQFGYDVALSGSGEVLVVGGYGERSNATGIGGDQANDAAGGAGAVYLY